jgi:ribosomal protein S27E
VSGVSRVPFGEPVEADEWVYTNAARIECESCGEWIYTRRRSAGGPSAFPPECQVCGAALRDSQTEENDGFAV